MDNWNQMEQIEIILPKQKCLEQALSLRVGIDRQNPGSLAMTGLRGFFICQKRCKNVAL